MRLHTGKAAFQKTRQGELGDYRRTVDSGVKWVALGYPKFEASEFMETLSFEAFLTSNKRFPTKLLRRLVYSRGFINLNDSGFSWLEQQLLNGKKVVPESQFS